LGQVNQVTVCLAGVKVGCIRLRQVADNIWQVMLRSFVMSFS